MTIKIRRTNGKLPWTHFHVDRETGRVTGFKMDSCESCGGPVQAVNAVGLMESPARLIVLGLVESPSLPPEGYYSEEAGMEACYHCNG